MEMEVTVKGTSQSLRAGFAMLGLLALASPAAAEALSY
jgi:hypothetical protein